MKGIKPKAQIDIMLERINQRLEWLKKNVDSPRFGEVLKDYNEMYFKYKQLCDRTLPCSVKRVPKDTYDRIMHVPVKMAI